jgi:hypothetical protein
LRNGAAQRALTKRGQTAATLERSSAQRRGSGDGKPARQTPGRWGKCVRRSSVDRRDERRAGEKKIGRRLVAPFKGRRGTTERGGLATEMPCGVEAAWGLAPTGGRHPDRGPAVTRAGSAPLFRQWRTDAADTQALAVGGTGSE